MSQEEIIHKIAEFVAIDSTASNPAGLHEVVNFIAALLAPHRDITVERFISNGVPSLLAYYGKKRPVKFDVLLSGHVDAVAGKPHQFAARVEGNKLFARGAYDMKAAALVMTDVFITAGGNTGRQIGLQITADEEIGGYNGVLHQIEQGVNSRFTIFGEMTDLEICNETRGICWVEVGFRGTNAHGGYAWEGVNAITKASDFAQALLKKFPVPKKREWTTTANIAAISTDNTTYNMVPDAATVKVDFRFTPEDPQFRTLDAIEAMIKTIAPDAEILDIPTFAAPVAVATNNPDLKYLLGTYEAKTGRRAKLIKRYASGDNRHFASIGEAAIEFGLGGGNLHADEEYVDINTIAPYRATLLAFLTNPIAPAKRSKASKQAVLA